MKTPNFPSRADVELNHIRTAVAGLPTRLRHTILNRCDKLAVLYRRMPSSKAPARRNGQADGPKVSAPRRIVAALLAGRVLSYLDSDEFETTAFHSRIADARRIIARQYPDRNLRSRFTEDNVTEAGRPFKIYWLD